MNYVATDQTLKTILIVDDQPNNLQLILQYLKNTGYKILIAVDGQKAIETATAYRLDLILLDVMMSGIDGFATCNYLKQADATKDIPIIFMTALSAIETKVRGLELGAVDYLTKPINQNELLARIKTHLALHNLNQSLSQDAQRQKLLLEISDRIRQNLDFKSILATAVREIQSFLNCDRVWLTHLSNNDLSLQAEANAQDVKFHQAIAWQDFCDHQEEYLTAEYGNIKVVNPIKHSQVKERLSALQKPIRIIAPILINSKQLTDNLEQFSNNNILWGWLIIDYQEAWQWQREEIKLLRVLTNQLAIAIKQALLYKQLLQQVSIDSLTQVHNRRYFDRQLNLEWRRLARTSSCLSLIMCDLDYFKLYNDTYGHQQGDQCLQQVAQAISDTLKRPADVVARYGGEEFIIILPQTHRSGAIKVAEKISMAIKQLKIPHLNSKVDSIITMSMGVACMIPDSQENPLSLLKAADLALYQAKKQGRNCVAVDDQDFDSGRQKL